MENEFNYGVPTGHVPRIGAMANNPVVGNTAMNFDEQVVFGVGGRGAPQVKPAQSSFTMPTPPTKKHNHYYKDVSKLEFVDVYRVLGLFNVTDACIQHAVKKLLVAGGRGAGKDIGKDIQEAIDSLVRYQEIQKENGK